MAFAFGVEGGSLISFGGVACPPAEDLEFLWWIS